MHYTKTLALASCFLALPVLAFEQPDPPAAQTSPVAWSSLTDAPSGVPVDARRIGKRLSLTVGQSIDFGDASTSYSRVYVDDPKILSAYTVNPHQVVVSGKAAGKCALVLTDSTGKTTAYVVKVNASVRSLQQAMENAFPFDRIDVSANGATVVLSGYVLSKDEYKNAEKIASAYSKNVYNALRVTPAHAREVSLDVTFAEVDRSKLAQSGFNFLSLGRSIAMTGTGQSESFSAPHVGGSGNDQGVTISNPMQMLLFNSDLDIGATLQNLEQRNIAQILAQPTINTLSGHTARFMEGGMFPYPVIQPGGGGNNTSSITIEFVPYGVMLVFEPVVLDDGTIRLYVDPEVSALDYSNEVSIAGYTIPAIDTRTARTYVELKDGQTFALSGLLDHRITDEFAHMPNIAKIPVLGWFFRSKNRQATTTNLVVLVTAHLVNPLVLPTAPPALPQAPIPYLDQPKFDARVQKGGKR